MPAPANHNGRTREASPLTFRVSPAERAEIERRAAAVGLSVSDYLRARALGRQARPR